MDTALLDTDTLSEVIELRDPIVQQHALAYSQAHGPLAFSSMTRYEILRGYLGQNATKRHSRFLASCRHAIVFGVADAIFDRAADLWAAGRRGGHPHPDADLI